MSEYLNRQPDKRKQKSSIRLIDMQKKGDSAQQSLLSQRLQDVDVSGSLNDVCLADRSLDVGASTERTQTSQSQTSITYATAKENELLVGENGVGESERPSRKWTNDSYKSFTPENVPPVDAIDGEDLSHMVKQIPNFDFAAFLDRHYKNLRPGVNSMHYNERELVTVIQRATDIFKNENTLLEIQAPLIIVGDLHGQFNDLINIFLFLGRPPRQRYLFLGDYVDRGSLSIETMILLMAYKVLYPNHIYLLRGNHECGRVNRRYGFIDECLGVYGEDKGMALWKLFQRSFNWLSVIALVNDSILCMHGGLSPEMDSLSTLRRLKKPHYNPSKGLINDILWADPELNIDFWRASSRGTGFTFGPKIVDEICKNLGVQLIVRAHQLCMDGYSWFAGQKLLTLFSAPSYCNVYKNAGAVLKVSADLHCQLVAIVPDGPKVPEMVLKHRCVWNHAREKNRSNQS